jgi:hypothetical protein
MNGYLIAWCMIEAALATALIQKLRGKRLFQL